MEHVLRDAYRVNLPHNKIHMILKEAGRALPQRGMHEIDENNNGFVEVNEPRIYALATASCYMTGAVAHLQGSLKEALLGALGLKR